MKNTMILNGVQFEVMNCKPPKIKGKKIFDLMECYANPSKIKQDIFYKWNKWMRDNFDWCSFMWISSYNNNKFTLMAVLYTDNHEYIVRITKDHNRVWIIN